MSILSINQPTNITRWVYAKISLFFTNNYVLFKYFEHFKQLCCFNYFKQLYAFKYFKQLYGFKYFKYFKQLYNFKYFKQQPAIGLMSRVFANGPGDQDSIPGRVIRKIQKMVLDITLLSTQHYNVRIKGKVEQSRKWSSTLPNTSVQ